DRQFCFAQCLIRLLSAIELIAQFRVGLRKAGILLQYLSVNGHSLRITPSGAKDFTHGEPDGRALRPETERCIQLDDGCVVLLVAHLLCRGDEVLEDLLVRLVLGSATEADICVLERGEDRAVGTSCSQLRAECIVKNEGDAARGDFVNDVDGKSAPNDKRKNLGVAKWFPLRCRCEDAENEERQYEDRPSLACVRHGPPSLHPATCEPATCGQSARSRPFGAPSLRERHRRRSGCPVYAA